MVLLIYVLVSSSFCNVPLLFPPFFLECDESTKHISILTFRHASLALPALPLLRFVLHPSPRGRREDLGHVQAQTRTMDAISSLLCGLASVSLAASSHAISSSSASTQTPTPAAIAWALVGAGAAVSPLLIILPVAGKGPPSIRGALSGAALSSACLLSSPAAERLGPPAAAALAAAAASLSSFVASVGPAGDWSSAADVAILKPGLAAPGLVLLLLGAAACAAASRGDLASAAAADVVEGSISLLEREEGDEGQDEEAFADTSNNDDNDPNSAVLLGSVPAAASKRQERIFWEGLALSLSAGLLAGAALLPMRAAPLPLRGLCFLPSIALGALVVGPSSAALLLKLSGESGATAAPRSVRARCALAGVLLAAAVAAAVVAVSRSRGGLAAVCPAVAIGFAVAVSTIEVAAAERRRRSSSPLPPSASAAATAIISRPRSFALSLAALAVGAGLLSASV